MPPLYPIHSKPHPEPKREKEPKKPVIKKPLNAFMLYMKEMRAKVIAECTLKESAAINQILGRRVSTRVGVGVGVVYTEGWTHHRSKGPSANREEKMSAVESWTSYPILFPLLPYFVPFLPMKSLWNLHLTANCSSIVFPTV